MPSCFQSFYWTQKELWGTHTLKLLSFYHHNYVDLSFSPDFFFLSFFFFFSYFSQTKKLCFLWRVEGRDPVVNEANCCQEEDWFMDFYVLPRLYSAKMTRSKLKTRPRQSVPSLHLPPRTSFPNPPSSFFLSFHLLLSYFLFPSSLLFSLFLSLFFSVARKETKLCDVLVFYLINGGTSPTKTIVAVNCSYQVERMSQWL